MKKQLPLLLAVIAVFFFSSCKKDLADNNEIRSAENLPSKANKRGRGNEKGVPFKGTYTTAHQVLQSPPMFKQRVSGTGNASHLGKSSFVAITDVNLTTRPPFAVSGTRILTAANGDQIFTTFTGTSTPLAPGSSRANLHDVIVGGTGRFQNASGSFDAVAISDQNTSTFEATFDGYINY